MGTGYYDRGGGGGGGEHCVGRAEATSYSLSTDQFGTQLDPPPTGRPSTPRFDELLATFAVRPLVVMHHGDAQAEGVASLVDVPATGCLLPIGFPHFGGGEGGYARYVAICPPGTKWGVRIGGLPEAPLQKYDSPRHWETGLGMRVR